MYQESCLDFNTEVSVEDACEATSVTPVPAVLVVNEKVIKNKFFRLYKCLHVAFLTEIKSTLA